MSKLMWILGILLIAVGLALGLLTMLSPGKMDVLGLKADTAAILLVGGILSIGLGGVIDALRGSRNVVRTQATAPVEIAEEPAAAPSPARFGRKPVEAAAATAAVATAAVEAVSATSSKAAEVTKTSVADTIAALDEAKADIKKALGGMDTITTPEEPVEVAQPVAEVEEPVAEVAAADEAESDLYVVEEKIIRGRPARVLSDETVEAETDEGWMRFENLDHLNEYLDSVEEQES